MVVIEDIKTGVIKTIRRLVGHRLAKLPSAPNTEPLAAVIRDRVKGSRPNYPFIVVDVDDLNNSTPWLKHTYYDEQRDTQVYVREQRIIIKITCYGKESESILSDLSMRLEYDVDRYRLNEETGATFNRFEDIFSQPAFLSTDFVESHTMNAIFYAESTWSPTYEDAKNITRVLADGEFYESLDKSDEPHRVSLDEPQST